MTIFRCGCGGALSPKVVREDLITLDCWVCERTVDIDTGFRRGYLMNTTDEALLAFRNALFTLLEV